MDLARLRADAEVTSWREPGAPADCAGIDGSRRPVPSLIDCFVTNLQLAQVLMYELDGVARSESNTLWMLRTVLDAAPEPSAPSACTTAARSFPVHTRVTGKHLLPLRGGTWRNVEIAGEFAGVSLRCSLAHELPAAVAARAA
ncbi:AvrD family protein [Streptomyces smyrnaeus]|uniref:AvrD family protein n=1 Tax=Streptomyces smyrnaeus TaxID=1387713 RepID=UPI0033BE56FB